MAQYIPKTAWRVNNVVHRYGQSYLGLSKSPASFFAGTQQPSSYNFASEGFNSKNYTHEALRTKFSENQASLIDLRDETDRLAKPIIGSVAMHHHDLLSGACNPLLPSNKDAEIFVLAKRRQRGVNGYNALSRWGFTNVVVVDEDALVNLQ